MCEFFMASSRSSWQRQITIVILNRLIYILQRLMQFFSVVFNILRSLWWMAFGLGNYWDNKLSPRSKECRLRYNNGDESVQVVDTASLKLEQFYLAFLVLFIGHCLALMQFIRERIIVHHHSPLVKQSTNFSIHQNLNQLQHRQTPRCGQN